MSNDVTTSDGGAPMTPSTSKRRALWVATGVAGLTGVVGLAALGGLAARDNKSDDGQRVAENHAAAPQNMSDASKSDGQDAGASDRDNKDRDNKDRDKDKDRDKGDEVREVACDDDDLIEALEVANRDEGGTLKLAPDCQYELDQFDKKSDAGLPTIKQEIKIEGNGATIKREAEEGFRIFRVADGGDLTLKDVTVKNGAAAERERKPVKYVPEKAEGNQGGTGGGAEAPAVAPPALAVAPPALAVAPPALAAAPAPPAPPAKDSEHGKDSWDGKDGKDSEHGKDGKDGKDGKEHEGDGGGLLVERGGKAHVVNSKFVLNSAEENGGAIANFGRVEVENSTLDNNHAGENGGAIFNAGVLEVEGSRDGKGAESRITNNTAGENGGGIANGNGDKKKDHEDGKGDHVNGDHDDEGKAGTVEIEKTLIEGNTAKKNGGGLFSNDGFVDVSWTFVKNNTAENGGGIYAVDTVLTVKHSTIEKNKAHQDGGGIYNVNSEEKKHDSMQYGKDKDEEKRRGTATVTDSEILENSAGRFGGGIFNGEPFEEPWAAGNMAAPSASSNHKDHDDDFEATLVLRDTKIKENFAGWNGGGIYNNEGKVTLTNTKVTKNKANNGNDKDHHGIAGGIFNNDGKVKLDDDSTITDNDPTNCANTVEDCFD
ncbi:hypothetical protein [Micromonospora inositola]|uniref:Polymorphic outer membrane protein repeat-containing protein n=1 Tax=Micromonospora inositola TaxID=47865 RepID=A0A1C5J340_9ACTN|nr:hypothetical protein [Micromonospora inositola]SCG64671.1 polymorphic outer membrane protein repeat-containing protein [Micromonospora inositola]